MITVQGPSRPRLRIAAAASGSRGYALIAALIAVAVASLAVTLAVSRAQADAQRERELQLLFVGGEYRRSIAQYFAHPPLGQPNQYPAQLADLVEDRRGPSVRRWLRRLYPDPMTGAADWELVRVQERIVGVYSRSSAAPLRHGNFDQADASFANAASYQGWRFNGVPAAPGQGSSSGSAAFIPKSPTDCELLYAVPALQCTEQTYPPVGHDAASCQAIYQQQYQQCQAAVSQP